jgi:hypothetical protein
MMLIYIIFKNPVLTSKKTQYVSMTTVSLLMLFEETLAVYSENHTKPTNTLSVQNAELFNAKVGGTYSYHRVLKN